MTLVNERGRTDRRRTRPARMRAHRVAALALALALTAAGCSGGSGDDAPAASPTEVLATAKSHFDSAQQIALDMATTAKPTSGNAVLKAQGTLTHQPAFQGTVTVVLNGLNADVPVTSVDGAVHALLPLTTSYQVIDPADYSAPDPAAFADPETGLSSLLGQMQGVTAGGEVRRGDEVLTTYSGTLTGEQLQTFLPSTPADDTITAVVGIDDDGEMATLSVTGDFFAYSGPVTYDISFDYVDEPLTITAP